MASKANHNETAPGSMADMAKPVTTAPTVSRANGAPQHPTLSIIVPVYNVEDYLNACLDSLQAQTFSDIEIVCVNDGSPDGSGGFLPHGKAKTHASLSWTSQTAAFPLHATQELMRHAEPTSASSMRTTASRPMLANALPKHSPKPMPTW